MDLFEESLATHTLRRFRKAQLKESRKTGSAKNPKELLEANQYGKR